MCIECFIVNVFGSYLVEDDFYLFFGFVCLYVNIGGILVFFVIVLCVCFGYNCEIFILLIDWFFDFLLVKYVIDGNSVLVFGSLKGCDNVLVVFNCLMGEYILFKKGVFFFGVGVWFIIYKVFDIVVLFVMVLLEDLEFYFIGIFRFLFLFG